MLQLERDLFFEKRTLVESLFVSYMGKLERMFAFRGAFSVVLQVSSARWQWRDTASFFVWL